MKLERELQRQSCARYHRLRNVISFSLVSFGICRFHLNAPTYFDRIVLIIQNGVFSSQELVFLSAENFVKLNVVDVRFRRISRNAHNSFVSHSFFRLVFVGCSNRS